MTCVINEFNVTGNQNFKKKKKSAIVKRSSKEKQNENEMKCIEKLHFLLQAQHSLTRMLNDLMPCWPF